MSQKSKRKSIRKAYAKIIDACKRIDEHGSSVNHKHARGHAMIGIRYGLINILRETK